MNCENPDFYSEMVDALAKPGEEIVKGLAADSAHLLHMVVGVCGEAGELLDAVKKHVIYGKTLDMDNVVEELGDLEFYLEGIRAALGVSRQTTLSANISKLAVRYNKGVYSDEAAQLRADKSETGIHQTVERRFIGQEANNG